MRGIRRWTTAKALPHLLTLLGLLLLTFYRAYGQSPGSADLAVLHGAVRDSSGHAVHGASVYLQLEGAATITVPTDSNGNFRCAELHPGIYSLRAEKAGDGTASFGPIHLREREMKQIDLVLKNADAAPASSSNQPGFFDQPQFTVAGVTNTMNYGGHGSDTVSRTSQSLAKDVAALDGHVPSSAGVASPNAEEKSLHDALGRDPANFEANYKLGVRLANAGNYQNAVQHLEQAHRVKPDNNETAYQLARVYFQLGEYDHAIATAHDVLAREEKAEIHHLLGEIEEKQKNPLQAVREYQRAAELEPSESNLFDWGTELLTHRAFAPAIEVFTKGNRLFPNSARMLVGLGVAWYASGSSDLAAKFICEASDLNPTDPSPYVVLGKMQTVNAPESKAVLNRFERFLQTEPDNPLANYYYAVALKRSLQGPAVNDSLPRIESLLQKAVHLDPKLAAAFLQLGMLYEERDDRTDAIVAYQRAIEADPESGDGHYRLAQAYRRAGEAAKAEAEIRLYNQISRKSDEEREREAREVQQFVYTLRDSKSPAPRP
jgi:tetratricopeptide (TPR) repeat protein